MFTFSRITVGGIILLHKPARFKETASKHEKIRSKNKACHDILLLLLLLIFIIIIVVILTLNYGPTFSKVTLKCVFLINGIK